ncbi:MAG TPA: histidine kinase [Chloroflexota bacterium]|jgi:signal transduction histidine kinase|nr:histidine kinase [Chloroflexota bacterium]
MAYTGRVSEPPGVGQEPARPRWERLAIPGAVAVTWLLALVIDIPPWWCPCFLGLTWAWRAALLGVIGLTWLLEFRGLRAPRPIFALAITLPVALLNAAKVGALSILFLPLMVAWVGDRGSRRDSMWALGVAFAGTFSYLPDRDVEGQLSIIAACVTTWLLIRGARLQRRLVIELRAAQADLARQATLAERRRIAGEVHDVAAHSLAVTMLLLTGARLLLQRLNADQRAIDALAEAERFGRQSLDDLRRTVGLLDDGASGGTARPMPTAADIPALVDGFRIAGLDVTLTARGDLTALPPATGLALYRIAQEALANAVRHAPGTRVSVELEIGSVIRLLVRNTGLAGGPPPQAAPRQGSGHGLAGMQERARLLGGQLTAGQDGPDGSGWAVSCILPAVTDLAAAEPGVTPEPPVGAPHAVGTGAREGTGGR